MCVQNYVFALDGHWSGWSDSTACTATCGNATKQQVRQCNNPPQSFGGQPCQGEATQTVACTFINCPVGKHHMGYTSFQSAEYESCIGCS
jgi:Thrombospondin type 1 domain